MEIRVVDGESPDDVEAIRALFREYEQAIGVDLCFEGFAEELAGLPGTYGPPGGRLLLALQQGGPIGCVGVRPLAGEVAELRRLYVRPVGRRRGAGRRLLETAIASARELGYRRIQLETLATMTEAVALYRSIGFREVPPEDSVAVTGPPSFQLQLDF